MYFLSLREILIHYREDIIQKMKYLLDKEAFSPYKEFMLHTEEGKHRLNIWIDKLIRSLDGEGARKVYFTDEERDGYTRAIQGFKLEFSFQVHQRFQGVLWEILGELAAQKKMNLLIIWEEIQELNEVLFKGYHIIANSFLRTREERINKKMSHLQEVFDYTQRIITTFNLKEILDLMLKRVTKLFMVNASLQALYPDGRTQGFYNFPMNNTPSAMKLIMDKTLKERATLFMDERGNIYQNIDQINMKRVVSVPIQAHGHYYGVLIIYNDITGFNFTYKEIKLLYQFTHIAAVAIENAFMLEEIEQRHKQLSLLTGRMITIQEEERRRLALDIHDTLAQVLTGIGYKIQLCKELYKKRPELLMEQLDALLKIVNKAVDQSRALISSLRPEMIDSMGLVPALQRLIDNFIDETSIRVAVQLPKRIQVPNEISICLFRIVQEALMNVYKHAETDDAKVILYKQAGNIILVVADRGKGFEMAKDTPWIKDQDKLGLLSIKERVEAVKGILVIDAGINRGCRIETRIPIVRGAKTHVKN
jgi:signal transduction histidine kinase